MRGKLKRKFAVVMASVLALSNIQTAPVFAAVEEERTIIRFEELPKKYAVQELELGAAEEDIRFPGSLWADMVIVKQTNEGSKTEETEEKEAGKTEEGKAETEPSVEVKADSGTDSIMEQQAGDADPSVSTEKEKALPGDGEKALSDDSSDDGTVSEPETTGSDTTGTVGTEKEEEPEIKQPESDAEENKSPNTGLESEKPAKEENDAGKPSGNLPEYSGNSEEQKFDEVINRLNKGLVSLEQNDYEGSNAYFKKAQAIVTHLSTTLDHQYEVSGGLASLYEYFNYQILQANIKKSPEPVEEVLPMITELKEAFSQADKQVRMGHTG